MVCMKWTSGSDRNVPNSCRNGGANATGQLMVCALKDFKVWRFRNHFGEASFRLRNLVDHYFSPVFTLFITPNELPSISLQFLLHEIIQKPILHQNKLKLKH